MSLDAIFDRDVQPALTAPPSDAPRLLVIGGLPGTRKSSLSTTIANQLGIHDAVILDGDDLDAVLPGFDAVARESGWDAASDRFAAARNYLYDRVLEHTRDRRQHLVCVGGFISGGFVSDYSARFPDRRQDVAYTAMHPALAQLGVMYRHHLNRRTPLPLLSRQQADRDRLRDLLEQPPGWDHVSAVHVVDSLSGRVAGSRGLRNGRWQPGTDLARLLDDISARPWDASTRETFHRWRAAVAGAAPGSGWAEHLASVDRLAATGGADDGQQPPYRARRGIRRAGGGHSR
jgi:hypothetical protein